MKIVFLTVLLVAFLAVGQSLKCYTCFPSKKDNKFCNDLSESTVTECSNNENACLFSLVNGESTRTCTEVDEKKRNNGCRESKSTKTCYCTGDLCNAASSTHSTGKMATLTIGLYLTWKLLI